MFKMAKLIEKIVSKYANHPPETLHYKNFIIKVIFEDDDWIAEISDPKDEEGYMPEFSIHKETAINKAKAKIDKVLAGK